VDSGSASTASGEGSELGWSAYLTLYSQERNVDSEGNPRVYLNQQDMQQLHTELSAVCSAEWANFIVAYRQFGPYTGTENGVSASGANLDLTQQGGTQITQVLDLIGKKTQVRPADGGESVVLTSPFSTEGLALFLPQLMDKTTTIEADVIPGRININEAPRAVLMGIPGITEEMVSAIIQKRQGSSDGSNSGRISETWLAAEGVVTLDEMRTLLPFVNAGGDVFRAQIVGYFQGGGPAARQEVVFDASADEPRVLFLRDISHLGRGYSLETLGVDYSPLP
jgi:DNA uptake protein ComE-like DNA-binding protein